MPYYKIIVSYLDEGSLDGGIVKGDVIHQQNFQAENLEQAKEIGAQIADEQDTIIGRPYQHTVFLIPNPDF